jgi:DNA repair protein SbcD/Mre11
VAPVVVISGNHDSAARVGYAAELLDRAGVHVRTVPERVGEPIVLGGVHVYAIPYLEPDLVRDAVGATGRGHAPVVQAAMRRVAADWSARGGALDETARSVVVAHAFVAGGAVSASERDLAVGGAGSVPPWTFAGVDYVALGHLHGPQAVGTNGRYAGSPVPFSFSETGRRKSVAVVDLAGEHPVAELIPHPEWRPLARLRGELEALLSDPAHDGAEGAWVQAVLTDPVRPADAMERLRRRFPHAVSLEFEPQGDGAQTASGSYSQRLRDLDDTALLARFVADVRAEEASGDELELLEAALSAGRIAELSS